MTSPRSTRPDQPGQVGPPDHPGTGPYREGLVAGQPSADASASPSVEYMAGSEAEHAHFEPEFDRNAWPAFMAAAIGGVAIGIVLLVWPKATLTIVAVLIGVSLIVAGLLRLIDGFTAHDASGGRRIAHVLIGLLAVIVGLYCIRHYHVTIAALAVIVGLFWVLHGIADIAAGLFGGPASGRALAVLAGVLSLFAGLIVLFWPTISITVLVVVMGIWLIIYGLIMGVTALSLRRRADDAADNRDLAPA
jgi:uncharacterized membrane protein HdeD (DUF308 family)